MKRFPNNIRKIVNVLGWILFFILLILLLVALVLSAPSAEGMLTFLLIVLSLLCEGYFMRNRTFGPGFMGIATFIVNKNAWPISTLLPNIPLIVHIFWINLILVLLAYAFQKKKGEAEMKRSWNILGWIVF